MVTLGQTYIMPKHKTTWRVVKIDDLVYLEGARTTLPCKLGTIEWMIERGLLKELHV